MYFSARNFRRLQQDLFSLQLNPADITHSATTDRITCTPLGHPLALILRTLTVSLFTLMGDCIPSLLLRAITDPHQLTSASKNL